MKTTGAYPSLDLDGGGRGVVSHAGGILLTETVRVSGLDRELSGGLAPWRHPGAKHDPGKIVADLALSLALGGDCLADVAVLRAEPEVFGPVASDPTVSRLIARLATDATASADDPLVVDLDATLVAAHSEKEKADRTWKKGFGFHPLWAFADHGPAGPGEPLAVQLRPGNAGSNSAADHITVATDAIRQLPRRRRRGDGTRPAQPRGVDPGRDRPHHGRALRGPARRPAGGGLLVPDRAGSDRDRAAGGLPQLPAPGRRTGWLNPRPAGAAGRHGRAAASVRAGKRLARPAPSERMMMELCSPMIGSCSLISKMSWAVPSCGRA